MLNDVRKSRDEDLFRGLISQSSEGKKIKSLSVMRISHFPSWEACSRIVNQSPKCLSVSTRELLRSP